MKYILAIICSLLLTSCAEILCQDSKAIPYCINDKCQIHIVHYYDDDMTDEYQTQYKLSAAGGKICICKY